MAELFNNVLLKMSKALDFLQSEIVQAEITWWDRTTTLGESSVYAVSLVTNSAVQIVTDFTVNAYDYVDRSRRYLVAAWNYHEHQQQEEPKEPGPADLQVSTSALQLLPTRDEEITSIAADAGLHPSQVPALALFLEGKVRTASRRSKNLYWFGWVNAASSATTILSSTWAMFSSARAIFFSLRSTCWHLAWHLASLALFGSIFNLGLIPGWLFGRLALLAIFLDPGSIPSWTQICYWWPYLRLSCLAIAGLIMFGLIDWRICCRWAWLDWFIILSILGSNQEITERVREFMSE